MFKSLETLTLTFGEQNYWSQEECRDKFSILGRQIHFTMMCALGDGDPTTDACNGDSGGPLYDQYKDRVRFSF